MFLCEGLGSGLEEKASDLVVEGAFCIVDDAGNGSVQAEFRIDCLGRSF